jgi:RNA recognition motif-containing protein
LVNARFWHANELSNPAITHKKETLMNIYVGNLSHDVSEDDLRQLFEAFGQIQSVMIVKDKFSGQSRGFGFVEMASKSEAQSAIDGVNNKELKGQNLNVNEARPRTENQRGGGGRRRF